MPKTDCYRGHPLSGENLYVAPDGERVCRICARRRVTEWAERKRAQEPPVEERRYQRSLRRLWAKIDKNAPNGCWLWQGQVNDRGYGRASFRGKGWQAHRLVFELVNGPIPEGLEPDHLCRVRRCVRPEHIELVTHRENTLRGNSFAAVNARKTHCPTGHPYDESNTKWYRGFRYCRECKRLSEQKRRARLRNPDL